MSQQQYLSSARLSRRGVLKGSLLLGAGFAATSLAGCSLGNSGKTTLNIANVANPATEDLEKLTKSVFERKFKDFTVNFITLPEAELRQKVTRDVAANGGEFDAVVIGPYEISQWAEQGWLEPLSSYAKEDSSYKVDDLIDTTRSYLSHNDDLYAVPVYAETANLMYRADVASALGITVPDSPTWEDIFAIAEAMHGYEVDGSAISGVTMRGVAGELMTPLLPMLHTYGGRLFAPDWRPTLTEEPTDKAIADYVSLLQQYGQPGVASAAFTDCLATMSQGGSGLWIDANVAATTLENGDASAVAGELGYALAPTKESDFGGNFWSWALATVATSKKKDAVWKFLSWATGPEYAELAGEELGWTSVPPGTRKSTYELSDYLAATPNAEVTLKSFERAEDESKIILKDTAPGRPVSYFDFPNWWDFNVQMTQPLSAAIANGTEPMKAVAGAQAAAEAGMKQAGKWNG